MTKTIDIEGASSVFIPLRNGSQAHYTVAGPDAGEPVVLLHGGLPGSSGSAGWRFMIPALAQAGFRVYAPDRPGFGQADTRKEYWPVRGMASWTDFVMDFVDALGLESFNIAGNSQGAQVAAYIAVTIPERIKKVLLVASGGFNASLEVDPSKVVKGSVSMKWDGTAAGMRELIQSINHRPDAVGDDVFEARAAAGNAQREAFAAARDWNKRAQEDPNLKQLLRLKDRLDKLTIPMIYLYGRQDVVGPVENAYLQEDALPNVQMFYPDECGHQGQTDQPEMFQQVFIEFLRDGKVSAKTAEWAGVSTRRPVLSSVVATD